jgi:osmoprotectant transport system permease protein
VRLLSRAWDYLTDGANWTGDGGMAELLVEQLLLTVTALAIAVLIGLPLALWLGHLRKGGFLAINISNVGRAVPTFAVWCCSASGRRAPTSWGRTAARAWRR